MVTLETRIHRYIGESWEPRPTVGKQVANDDETVVTTNDLPVGSTLYLKDTGVILRWDGVSWTKPQDDYSFQLIAQELRSLHRAILGLRLGMIDAGVCSEQTLDDVKLSELVST